MAERIDEDEKTSGESGKWIDRDDDREPSRFIDRDADDPKDDASAPPAPRDQEPLWSGYPEDSGATAPAHPARPATAGDKPVYRPPAARPEEDLNAIAARELNSLGDDNFFDDDVNDDNGDEEISDGAYGVVAPSSTPSPEPAARTPTTVQRAQEFRTPTGDPYAEDAYAEEAEDLTLGATASRRPETFGKDDKPDDGFEDDDDDDLEDDEEYDYEEDDYESDEFDTDDPEEDDGDNEDDEAEDDKPGGNPPGGPPRGPSANLLSATEENPGRRWPLLMLGIAVVAIALVGIGGYGVMKERSNLQSEIRQLQARLATAVSPEDARASRERVQEVSVRNESLQAELEGLKLENSELATTVDSLEQQLEGRASAEAALVAQRDQAEKAAKAAAERQRQAPAAQVTRRSTTATPATAGAPWFVNFGSYAQAEAARRWAGRLRVESGRIVVQDAVASGNQVYRVRVIDLPSRDSAERVARALESAHKLPKLWVGKED